MQRFIAWTALGILLAVSSPNIRTAHAQLPSGAIGGVLTSSPIARSQSAGFEYNGKLYALGGFERDLQVTRTCEVFNLATNSWTALSPIPRAVTHSGVETVDGAAWVVGGFVGGDPGVAVDIVQIYDIAKDEWRAGPALPAPRAAGTLALLGRSLHFIGGLLADRQTDVSEHYVLDVDHPEEGWRAAAPLPTRRNHMSSAVLGGKLYVIGGQRGHDGSRSFSRLVHVYDYASDSWSRASDLPEARSHFEGSTFVYNGKIVVAGGLESVSGSDSPTDQILAYDPHNDTWSEIGRLPVGIHSFEGGAVGDQLIVAHGSVGSESDAQTSTYFVPLEPIAPDTLGFWPAVQDVHLTRGNSLRLESLLWTFRDAVPLTIDTAGLPDWLALTSQSSDTALPSGAKIGARIDATHLEPGIYRTTITATAPEYPPATLEIFLTVTPKSTDIFIEENGVVVAEAENFQLKRAGVLHDWTVSSRYESEGAAVAALPDQGANWDVNLAPNGPELGFRVRFDSPGTYFVWVRAWGPNNKADSWHVGIDGRPEATADRMTLLARRSWPPLWEWSNSTMDGPRATLEIPAPGDFHINLWMREDGTFLDRILLTTDADYVPAAIGPSESRRISSPVVETEAGRDGDELPVKVVLEPNYPNPFNPSTLIRYSLPTSAHVRLEVIDLLGQQVALLVDQSVGAGDHEARFEASDLPSGIYFYRLNTGRELLTRSMLLLR